MTARSFSWLGTCISIKSGGVKLVLLSQTSTLSEMMLSCKCFQHVNQMPTLSYMHANSIIIKNAMILNIMHNIFKLREINLIFGAFNTEHHSNLFIHFMYVLLGGYDPYFCNNFLPLEVFFRLFGVFNY